VLAEVAPLGRSEQDLLALVAAVEALSEHPLAAAVLAAAKARGIALQKVEGFAALPGQGLSGQVAGQVVLVGNARMMAGAGVPVAVMQTIADAMAQRGQTPVMVAVAGVPAGVIGIADKVRPGAAAVVAALKARGIGVAMISGDVAQTARAIGVELGIDDVQAGVLPGGKVDAVRALQEGGRKVAFVGDGINDAPALAAADVGVAIGTGTDVAVESADVVLMSGDPAGVVNAIEISRLTMRNIRQNLGWAFGYNILLVPVAAGVLYPLWGTMLSPALAAGAMAASSVLVLANALRLRAVRRVA